MSPLTECERFFAKVHVDIQTGCWLWRATQTIGGYGRFFYQGRPSSAHVAAYKMFKGPIPPGHLVRHTCDNAACVSPEHLMLGSHQDNMKDAQERGRFNRMNARLTDEQVLGIYHESGTQKTVAAKWRVSQSTVAHIKSGEQWSHLTGAVRKKRGEK